MRLYSGFRNDKIQFGVIPRAAVAVNDAYVTTAIPFSHSHRSTNVLAIPWLNQQENCDGRTSRSWVSHFY